jgi:hypothetical protein
MHELFRRSTGVFRQLARLRRVGQNQVPSLQGASFSSVQGAADILTRYLDEWRFDPLDLAQAAAGLENFEQALDQSCRAR